MSDSPTPDVSLREKAERATLGPWRIGFAERGDVYQDAPRGHEDGRTHIAYCGRDIDPRHEADAAYIAACSPDVILALLSRVERAEADSKRLREKADAYDRINTPEVDDFLSAVKNEALHQRERWSVEADGGKTDGDWFWLVGYLAGKALHDVNGKQLHHLITTAAALLNWHGKATGNYAAMRPGIAPTPEAPNAL